MIRSISPYVAGYFILYVLNLWLGSTIDGFPLGHAMWIMVVFGLVFSSIAHFVSRSATPLVEQKPAQASEAWILTLVIVYIGLVIIPGNWSVSWLLPEEWQHKEPI